MRGTETSLAHSKVMGRRGRERGGGSGGGVRNKRGVSFSSIVRRGMGAAKYLTLARTVPAGALYKSEFTISRPRVAALVVLNLSREARVKLPRNITFMWQAHVRRQYGRSGSYRPLKYLHRRALLNFHRGRVPIGDSQSTKALL